MPRRHTRQVGIRAPNPRLTRRILWLGERDRLGRRGRRLAGRFFAVLYISYRSNQGQCEGQGSAQELIQVFLQRMSEKSVAEK
jgi:hypothetical protein